MEKTLKEDFKWEEFVESPEFAKLKEEYADVFTQIKERTQLARGYVLYTTTIDGLGEVTIRTLTVRERNFIAANTATTPSATIKEVATANFLATELDLLLRVEQLGCVSGTTDWHISVSLDTALDKWLNKPEVKTKREALGNLSEHLEDTLLYLCRQVNFAAHVASAELIKNRPTPSNLSQ